MPLNLRHQTPAQFAARLREHYRAASKTDAARIATWIMDRIDAGDLTVAQVRAAFGMTAGQWTTLQSKLTALRTNYLAVQAALGE